MKRFSVQREPDIILKIERLSAVRNLPALLMNGMQNPGLGVMIARGDLAVEIGFERLSEIQEEILWICEAAHVPVIWATQVLETLNKTGYATRSEITDAAMSVRAECVMLNKGQFIVKTIKTLDDILTRQLGHVDKKRFIMRPLGIAKGFTGMDRESAKAI
jgi:pyruvate kinase